MSASEEIQVTAYARYEIDCDCTWLIVWDRDPVGEEIECDSCGAKLYVMETR